MRPTHFTSKFTTKSQQDCWDFYSLIGKDLSMIIGKTIPYARVKSYFWIHLRTRSISVSYRRLMRCIRNFHIYIFWSGGVWPCKTCCFWVVAGALLCCCYDVQVCFCATFHLSIIICSLGLPLSWSLCRKFLFLFARFIFGQLAHDVGQDAKFNA